MNIEMLGLRVLCRIIVIFWSLLNSALILKVHYV